MRLIDRYLLRELLIPLGFCLCGFLIFWIAFDLFNELARFRDHKLSVPEVGEYYLMMVPEFLVTVLPVALLLALLYALTNHARHHELVAIRTAGISVWRLNAPYYVVGVVFSVLLFLLNDFWLPGASNAAKEVLNRHVAVRADDGTVRQFRFRNDADNRNWNIGEYDRDTAEVKTVWLDWVKPDRTGLRLRAESGGWTNGVWTFNDVSYWDFRSLDDTPPRLQTNRMKFPGFTENPEGFQNILKFQSMSAKRAAKKIRFSLREILEYLELNPDLPDDEADMVYTQLHGRIAAPWTCLVVVLIAAPLGAMSGGRSAFVGVASSLVICFGFFILQRLGLALGTSGYLPAWLAAWLPNMLFAGIGVGLTWKVP